MSQQPLSNVNKELVDPPNSWHSLSVEQVLDTLQVTDSQGLSSSQAQSRREQYGSNQLREVQPISKLRLLLSQFANPVVYLLLAAAAFSALLSEFAECVAILLVLCINATIGFVTELRAKQSMDALRELTVREVNVRRDSAIKTIAAEQLVPGDIVIIDAGDVISADLRVIESAGLRVDESALTGESLPVEKHSDPVEKQTALTDQHSILFKGCPVTSGTGEAVVTSIGMQTQLGLISKLVQSSDAARSPLEYQLTDLSKDMIGFTLVVTLAVGVVGVLVGQEITMMVKSAVALAVATIPEGLPIVATLALARGMRRMAKHNALIEQLSAVETLGATTLIMTDKTGTLTENRMHVSSISTASKRYERDVQTGSFDFGGDKQTPENDSAFLSLLENCVLCNNASLGENGGQSAGDTMEIALLDAALTVGISRPQLLDQYEEIQEFAFDPIARRMATVHRDASNFRIAVKGAPESLLAIVDTVMIDGSAKPFDEDQRRLWADRCNDLASRGLRLLAIAGKQAENPQCDAFSNLTLLGIVGLNDPPRKEIAQTIAATHKAGIDVVMVTGDHALTARNIAQQIGLANAESSAIDGGDLDSIGDMSDEQRNSLREIRIFSRVTPEQKLELIALHQEAGDIVAMTGDGINDAPALKKADIGVAMGIRGTQVAREAADIVLRDDAFSTIVHAIKEGREIFSNIRRFTVYLLSCNLSEILVVSIAVIAGLPLPLLPLQILFLNLVTDVFPAFALGTIESGRDVLARPPRPPSEQILCRRQWLTIAVHGCSIALVTIVALVCAMYMLELDKTDVTTVSFYTLALAQLWHVFNMHNWRTSLISSPLPRNVFVWGAIVVCLLLLAVASSVPSIATTLQLNPLDSSTWLLIIGLSVVPVIARESHAHYKRWHQS